VSVHAYNLGVVKYDYKILCAVARILYLEIKKLFVNQEGTEKKKKVNSAKRTQILRSFHFMVGSPKACVSLTYWTHQHNTLPLFRHLWNSWRIQLPLGNLLP
jgi:hypothetical protein